MKNKKSNNKKEEEETTDAGMSIAALRESNIINKSNELFDKCIMA